MQSAIRKLLPRMSKKRSPGLSRRTSLAMILLFALPCVSHVLRAQDNVFTGTNTGNNRIRIAVADFKPQAADPQTAGLKHVFDATLYTDLSNAGVFDIVSKSMIPPSSPGTPAEMVVAQWSAAPSSAAMVAFGNLSAQGSNLVVNGFLFDTKNAQYPQVLAKQYTDQATEDAARQTAHRFADEIIFRLGGGVAGIAETKIYYVHEAEGNKEIWEMDYDGANQRQVTHIGTVSMSPRIAPDNSRIAFASLGKDGFQIRMYSLLLNRLVNLPSTGSNSFSPAWSPNGHEIAYASGRSGHSEIWISDAGGALGRQVSSGRAESSPVYNPKTGAQIAWISGRTGLPQLYIMNTDGSGIVRLTDGGYASSPSWSPNGQFITFAWNRKYGPGAPGGQDIYVIDVSTLRWIQLTHDSGRCDFPSWSPDGRHIVYANSADGRQAHTRVWTMLADGTQKQALSAFGGDMPNWSWK
jgi:TolB protein